MSAAQADIHVKVDPKVKAESEVVLKQIGISISDLINMTLRCVIRERRIPFDTQVKTSDLPRCMNIRTEAELEEYLVDAMEYNEQHPETYTIEEVRKRLGV